MRRYVAKRFLLAILGAFAVCAVLIFMIDMVELLRLSRRATDLSDARLLWMALLRLPAFTEILLAFAVLVGSIGALLSLNRKSELIVMRAGGMSVWQFLRPGVTVALRARDLRRHGLQSAGRRRPLGVRAPGGRGLRQGSRPAGQPPARTRGCARTAPTANPS